MLSIAMGKGWSGIASHQGTPCGSSTYRLRGQVRYTRVFALFSSSMRELTDLRREAEERDDNAGIGQ